jgi:hypothetical protein
LLLDDKARALFLALAILASQKPINKSERAHHGAVICVLAEILDSVQLKIP